MVADGIKTFPLSKEKFVRARMSKFIITRDERTSAPFPTRTAAVAAFADANNKASSSPAPCVRERFSGVVLP